MENTAPLHDVQQNPDVQVSAGVKRLTKIIAVTSGKGGVGKTNVSVNLGLALSGQGKQVMLLDADLGLGNVDVLRGVDPVHNLSHVIIGERTLAERLCGVLSG